MIQINATVQLTQEQVQQASFDSDELNINLVSEVLRAAASLIELEEGTAADNKLVFRASLVAGTEEMFRLNETILQAYEQDRPDLVWKGVESLYNLQFEREEDGGRPNDNSSHSEIRA